LFQEIPALAYQWVARRGFSFGPTIAAVAQLILQSVGGRHRITGRGLIATSTENSTALTAVMPRDGRVVRRMGELQSMKAGV